MLKRIFKSKRGSQIVEILIAIAIISVLAVTALGTIQTRLNDANDVVLDKIEADINTAVGGGS